MDIDIIIDPHAYFIPKGATVTRIQGACGCLPSWVVQALQQDAVSVPKAVECLYGFPSPPFGSKADIDEDGLHRYPGDPDMHPLMAIIRPSDSYKVFIYQSAIIAFCEKDKEPHITRMD